MSSISSAAAAHSTSDSSALECSQSLSAKSIHGASPCCGNGGLTFPASTMSAESMQADWVGSTHSILLPADSRASPTPALVSSSEREILATSGLKLAESLSFPGPLGSLAKTLLGSYRWGSTMCSMTWKHSVTPRGRLVYRLVPSAPRIDANGCSLLPTPSGVSSHGKNHVVGRLDEWGGSSNPFRGTPLGRIRCASFEEWMMGMPMGLTALMPSEMPSSPRSSRRSAKRSSGASHE